MSIDFGNLDPSLFAPSGGLGASDHFVELYDDDRALVDSVRTFVSIGISEGDAAIVIAEPAHREAFEAELDRVIELERARAEGLYLSVDAAEVLSRFMEDGLPDAARFDRVIGDLIGRAAVGGRNVRVFGEMVAMLWAEGNVAGALSLEDLWNRFSKRSPFRLFCAYPTAGFDDADLARLSAVCGRHSHVVVCHATAV